MQLLRFLQERCGDRVSAFELISRHCMELLAAHDAARQIAAGGTSCVVRARRTDGLGGEKVPLSELAEEALGGAIEAGLLADVALARTVAQAEAMWKLRETIPEAGRLAESEARHLAAGFINTALHRGHWRTVLPLPGIWGGRNENAVSVQALSNERLWLFELPVSFR